MKLKNLRYISVLILLLTTLSASADLIPTVVKIYDESEIEEMLAEGVIIERRRGDILLCYYPGSDDETVVIPNNEKRDKQYSGTRAKKENKNRVKKTLPIRGGNFNQPTLDEAIKFYDAGNIQAGEGFNSPYTGKGVIVGICDIGLDPLHPTFLDSNGKSRVKQITQYKEYEGIRKVLHGDEEYKEWQTDTLDKYHATHVAGILAGNGGGTVYKGVASEADIVASLSCLSDFGLLMGVEDIIDYAKEVGKPVVINLSMGNYVGAHDGSSLFSQYLDLCADDAIIVLSSGNEGGHTNTLTYDFPNLKPLEFKLGNKSWNQKTMYGMTDIWNNTSAPLKITLCIYDDETGEVIYEYEPEILEDWDLVTYEWNPDTPDVEGLSLDGYLIMTGGVDPENERYEVGLIYDFTSSRLIGGGWAKDLVSVKIEGGEGDEVDVFADGTYTRLIAMSGSPAPNSSMSISDLACGFRVVSVGMYGNRETYPVTIFDDAGVPDKTEICSTGSGPLQTVVHSSYGTLRDGRSLPITVAPGFPIMSAYSEPYHKAYPEEECFIETNGSLWYSSSGTSMSAPYVAGYIATWLQALPDLTVEDVLEMIAASNTHDIPDPDNPRNINGYFNPVAALKYAIDKSGISQIKDPIYLLSSTDLVEVFNLSGIRVYSGVFSGIQNLPKGLYVIKTPYGIIKKIL